jgi:hypothetical protein
MKKNILFGTIKVFDGKKHLVIEKAVFKEDSKEYKKMSIIDIIKFKIIGQTNISKEYTEVKASNEKRNKITGAYE